jgi:hypothetical protein
MEQDSISTYVETKFGGGTEAAYNGTQGGSPVSSSCSTTVGSTQGEQVVLQFCEEYLLTHFQVRTHSVDARLPLLTPEPIPVRLSLFLPLEAILNLYTSWRVTRLAQRPHQF